MKLLVLMVAATASSVAMADVFLMEGPKNTEVALTYTYVRANAPPGECGCFSMNGGSLSVAQPFKSEHVALVFDSTIEHASHVTAGGYDLTLAVFTVGGRYRPWPESQWSPFGQVLLGAAHASGSLVEGNTPAASDAALKFASNVGGGIDWWVNDRWSLRVIEAEYLLTTYSNRTNDHQNNLRLSVGAAFHFGAP